MQVTDYLLLESGRNTNSPQGEKSGVNITCNQSWHANRKGITFVVSGNEQMISEVRR